MALIQRLGAAALLAMACQAAPGSAAPPAGARARAQAVDPGSEFVLAPDEAVEITGASARVRFVNVVSDRRCPRQAQCTVSGPVTIEVGVSDGQAGERLVKLAVFDRDVGGPAMQGVTSCVSAGKLALRLRDVLPWPVRGAVTNRALCRASFVVASSC